MQGHKYGVYTLLLSKSNKWLFSGSTDNTIGVWTCKSRKSERFLDGHKSTVVSLLLSQNEQFLFSMGKNGLVLVWNLKSFTVINQLDSFSAPNSSLCIGLSDPIYTIFGRDRAQKHTLRAVNLVSGETVMSLKLHQKTMRCLILDQQNQFLFTGGTDGLINVLRVASSHVEHSFSAHTAPINALCVSGDDRFLASASDDGSVKVFDSANEFQQVFEVQTQVEVSWVMFARKKKHLFSGGWNLKPIKIWNVASLEISKEKQKIQAPGQFYLVQSAMNWNKECGKTAQQKVKEQIVDFEEGMRRTNNLHIAQSSVTYLKHLAQLKPGVTLKKSTKKDLIEAQEADDEADMADSKDVRVPQLDKIVNLREIKKRDIIESSEMGSLATSGLGQVGLGPKTFQVEDEDQGTVFKSKNVFKKRIVRGKPILN